MSWHMNHTLVTKAHWTWTNSVHFSFISMTKSIRVKKQKNKSLLNYVVHSKLTHTYTPLFNILYIIIFCTSTILYDTYICKISSNLHLYFVFLMFFWCNPKVPHVRIDGLIYTRILEDQSSYMHILLAWPKSCVKYRLKKENYRRSCHNCSLKTIIDCLINCKLTARQPENWEKLPFLFILNLCNAKVVCKGGMQ